MKLNYLYFAFRICEAYLVNANKSLGIHTTKVRFLLYKKKKILS